MRLHLVWIGKTRDKNLAEVIEDYLERIRRFTAVDVSELKDPPAAADEKRVIAAQGAKLIAALERDDYVILLDERGRELGSRELADLLDARQQSGVKRVAVVIGGFAGVNEEVRKRADLTLALSRMTFTHEMARVIITEQIYRAYSLLAGLPYHKV
ncbi:MAG: 23S rRNA (pseudouridine(1915)-N(3))-methyltransferase RlmH [Acidobacteria bacterium]|nr:23S rRNA (pseudouridine(1915)-N(3))-methyltransferase RlmH [Acidobacteriota bacterium]MBK8312660.1 23S rRNA (pseudouridine(1915)-N(3))-methyltransferase RlmH [Acidobacteriota bacterium]MBK9706854.1 23S rRNA (pseudouridine(1915)-N(3))-methyltransferase RlmH [Acidobacteriota bacterium]